MVVNPVIHSYQEIRKTPVKRLQHSYQEITTHLSRDS